MVSAQVNLGVDFPKGRVCVPLQEAGSTRMTGSGDEVDEPGLEAGSQRLDKWLWFARVAKSRTLSATLVTEGKVRVNGAKVAKPAHTVKLGDTVTIVMRQRMRVLRVLGMAQRRGSAEVAAGLFEDLSPPPPPKADTPAGEAAAMAGLPDARREPGSGRPTKRERREIDRFRFRSDSDS